MVSDSRIGVLITDGLHYIEGWLGPTAFRRFRETAVTKIKRQRLLSLKFIEITETKSLS